jgi:hypothetical protein
MRRDELQTNRTAQDGLGCNNWQQQLGNNN